jgi:hypothetical protein
VLSLAAKSQKNQETFAEAQEHMANLFRQDTRPFHYLSAETTEAPEDQTHCILPSLIFTVLIVWHE